MARPLSITVVAALLALAAVPAASAEAPVIITPAPVTQTVPYGTCPQGFAVTGSGVLERRIIRFLENGVKVKEIRHASFEGTLSGNGRSIPYGLQITFTEDWIANTLTKTGRFRYSKPDGSGLVVQDVGRTVQSPIVGGTNLSDTAGTIQEFDAEICTLLAG